MPKQDTEYFNPSVMEENFIFPAIQDFALQNFTIQHRLEQNTFGQDDVNSMMSRSSEERQRRREIVEARVLEVHEEFNSKLAKARELIAQADPKGVIEKNYSRMPIVPKVCFNKSEQATEGHGLTVPNKLGGIPDLRRYWGMEYRKATDRRPERSVEEMVKILWPKGPDGEFLSCAGTLNLGIYMYLMSQVVGKNSSFKYCEHSLNSLNGDFAFFAPWSPGFDNRLDACVMKLGNTTHGISEEEYLAALGNLGILEGEKDYHGEDDNDPNEHYVLTQQGVYFDLELYRGDYGDARTSISKAQHAKIDDVAEALNDWHNWRNPEHPFAHFAVTVGENREANKRQGDIWTSTRIHIQSA